MWQEFRNELRKQYLLEMWTDMLRMLIASGMVGYICYHEKSTSDDVLLGLYYANEICKQLINLTVQEKWVENSWMAGGIFVQLIVDWVVWILAHAILAIKCRELSTFAVAVTSLHLIEDYGRWWVWGKQGYELVAAQLRLLTPQKIHESILSMVQSSTDPPHASAAA